MQEEGTLFYPLPVEVLSLIFEWIGPKGLGSSIVLTPRPIFRVPAHSLGKSL